MLLAQVAGGVGAGWTLGSILIAIIVLAACVGIVFVAVHAFGLNIPPWVIQIFWICVVAFVAIIAIRFVLSL
jgi:hypothetical protein